MRLNPLRPLFLGGAVDRAVEAPVQVGQRLLQGHGLAGVLVAQQLQFWLLYTSPSPRDGG